MSEEAHEPLVDLLIPVYNEGANIARAIEEIAVKVPLPKRVIVVYDFDADDTVPVVRSLQARFPYVHLHKNDVGRGVLNAVRSGIGASKAEVVVITMADLSDDVAIVPHMVAKIVSGGYDVVIGSRYMEGGEQFGGPRLKRTLSRWAGLSLYWLGALPVHDATNAFRAYRRQVLLDFPIESRGGFAYSLEITAKAHAAGRKIGEVPSTWTDRSAGESRFRLGAWLPHYLKWYAFALTHRPRVRPPS